MSGSTRTVTARVRVEYAQVVAAGKAAGASVRGVGDELVNLPKRAKPALADLEASANKHAAAWTQAGIAIGAAGIAMSAAFVGSAKAAIDWESAFTGVLKTVNGTPAQLAAIEGGLRSMARSMPTSHAEIAAVAEAAGQLGVNTDSVVAFTKVMVELGDTTNLSADEAATSIAQMMNIMQSAPSDVDNLGAALVALGNNGASTERDIVQMAQRIAGSGKIIGLSEAQVLAFANAAASVGIEVEAGGSSISTTMTKIAQAVAGGGDELDAFAKVSGQSAEAFAKSFDETPAEAITRFIEGLGGIDEAGGNVFGTLERLGLSDIRVSRTLLSLAGSHDLLRESLKMGDEAWAENTALTTEADKRYATTAAQLGILRNKVVDAGISIGDAFLPAITEATGVLGNTADFVGDLPAPLRAATGAFTGVGGAALIMSGGLIAAAPRINETRKALEEMPRIARAARLAMVGFGGIAVLGAVGLAVANTAQEFKNLGDSAREGIDEMRTSVTSANLEKPIKEVEKLKAKINDLSHNDGGPRLGVLGNWDNITDNWGRTVSGIQSLLAGKGLSGGGLLGAAKEAQAQLATTGREFALVAESVATETGLSVEDVKRVMTEMGGIDLTAGVGAAYQQVMNWYDANVAGTPAANAAAAAIALQGNNAATAADRMKAFNDALENTLGLNLQLRADRRALQAAYLDADQALKDNGATLAKNTRAGIANAAALDRIATTAIAVAEGVRKKSGDDTKANAILATAHDRYAAMADKMGLSAKEAKKLADRVLGVKNAAKDPVVVKLKLPDQSSLPWWMRETHQEITVRARIQANNIPRNAEGGLIRGPGTGTSDSILSMVSNGEFVQPAVSVDYYGPDFMEAVRSRRLPKFADGGMVGAPSFATGGQVDLGSILSAWREAMGIITRDELASIRDAMHNATAGVTDAKRSRRDARRDVRDTKESNAERLAAAKRAVKDADGAKEQARAEKDLKRVRRDNREDLENANHRLAQSEADLKKARKESKDATAAAAQADRDYAEGKMRPTQQLSAALGADIKNQARFISNIETLARRGYTQLATQLLGQGDAGAEAMAADAVTQSDAFLTTLTGQVNTSSAQQAKLEALPTVFKILAQLATNKNYGISEVSWRTGIDLLELERAAATSKDLIQSAGGNVFLAELKRNGFADGGRLRGAGTSRQDNLIFAGSNGEHVMSEPAVRRNGGHAVFDAINNGSLVVRGGDGASSGVVFAPVYQIDARDAVDAAAVERRAIEGATQVAGQLFDEFRRTL